MAKLLDAKHLKCFGETHAGWNPAADTKCRKFKMVICPFCKGTGKMYEVNYRSWYNKKNHPTDINELIEERDCSYCMGRKEVANKDNIKVN